MPTLAPQPSARWAKGRSFWYRTWENRSLETSTWWLMIGVMKHMLSFPSTWSMKSPHKKQLDNCIDDHLPVIVISEKCYCSEHVSIDIVSPNNKWITVCILTFCWCIAFPNLWLGRNEFKCANVLIKRLVASKGRRSSIFILHLTFTLTYSATGPKKTKVRALFSYM